MNKAQRGRHRLLAFLYSMVGACALLTLSPSPCFGQRTVTSDAGGGRKIEMVYNSSNQLVETRTVDATGRLLGRVEHEYRPGFWVPQETTTAYWPDGKTVRSVVRVHYDENANFLSEAKDLFNEAGTQTDGTMLIHDPFTGIYHCSKWDASARAFQTVECPASEESAGAPKHAKQLTRDETIQQLELAKQAQREEQKRMSPAQAPVTAAIKQVGIILPAQLRPGERVSGSVVDDPEKYEGIDDLKVVRMQLPFESQGGAKGLAGWAFEAAGEGPQRADGPLSFIVPKASRFTTTLSDLANPARTVSTVVTIARDSSSEKPTSFEAPALCLKGGLCPVRGSFSGDSTKTFAAFGSRPALIVTETEDTAYIVVPTRVPTGPAPLIVAEGSQVVALPVDIAEFRFIPARRELRLGETVLVHVVLSGPEDLAEDQWQAGVFSPAASVDQARGLVPGFEPPPKGSEGVILLVVRNAAPEALSLRSAQKQTFVFKLTPDSFTRGEFKYHFVVEAGKLASLALQGTVLPFLAPVRSQPFQLAVEPSSK